MTHTNNRSGRSYFNGIAAFLAVAVIFAAGACSPQADSMNPFFEESTLPYGAPHFDKIKYEHYMPAFERGMEEQLAEIDEIANNPEDPTFENTMVALELSGELLERVQLVFFAMTSSNATSDIQDIQSEISPKLAAHSDNIYLNSALFERVRSLYENRENLDLDGPSMKLLEDSHRSFVRAGAMLTDEQQSRIREINEELSSLTTRFQRNLLEETNKSAVLVENEEELDGLSSSRIATAAEAAKDRGHEGKWLLTLSNTTRQPVLTSLHNRELRQRVWEASAFRGARGGDYDNREIIKRLTELRAERAEMLGYENFAEFAIETQTAGNPQNVLEMLDSMLPAVISKTEEEADQIRDLIASSGANHSLEPWDWEYYAEKVRQNLYQVDEDEIRNYFEFNNVLQDGAFYAMNLRHGITFEERDDIPVYHPDVRVFEVFDSNNQPLALFYADYFTRDTKRGGAWMTSFVRQNHLRGTQPVVVNVMNIPKASDGEPTLISYGHATTILHELGHGIHGMFSDVTFPSQSGTSVPRDFVEFPSTFEEDWTVYDQVLQNFARHHETGEVIPSELVEKMLEANTFNQGFDTMEYLAATYLDMEWHTLTSGDTPVEDVLEFEQQALERAGVDISYVPPRYTSTIFAHVFSGGYSAAYYAYIWSEILAADAFEFMKESGGLTRENGEHYRNTILSRGGSVDPMEMYIEFRGQEPTTDALLRRRGLK